MTDSLVPNSCPSSAYDKVLEFHQTYGAAVNIGIDDWDNNKLRIDLISEELQELVDALTAEDPTAVADALTDLAYVVNGAAISFGIDLDTCMAEVHRSNMTKLGEDGLPIYREDGKVMKGPNFEPPQLTEDIICGRFRA
jgi:predicted HAD superfamily Cof-like phosphohydrolase